MGKRLTILVLFVSVYCSGQYGHKESSGLDTLGWSDKITLNGYSLFSTKSKLHKLFKKADSVSKPRAEMGDCYTTTAYFKESEIYLCDTLFDEFVVSDNSLKFEVNGISFKVGENTDRLKQTFPKSFANKDRISSIWRCVRIQYSDSQFLLFMLNNQDKISEIEFWEDNS